MIHGDLKGVRIRRWGLLSYPTYLSAQANILVNKSGHALLADFGFLTVVSDPENQLSSSSQVQGGTARWMSPELLTPLVIGSKAIRPTIFSDYYSLGMVIYETISGHRPFHGDTDFMTTVKVLGGEHPRQGAEFTQELWGMLERCWASQPSERPSIGDVLRCLEIISSLSVPSRKRMRRSDVGEQSPTAQVSFQTRILVLGVNASLRSFRL